MSKRHDGRGWVKFGDEIVEAAKDQRKRAHSGVEKASPSTFFNADL